MVSACFLLTVGRFISFLARSRMFEVVSDSFLQFVVRFKSFFACCRSFQVVSVRYLLALGRFSSFQIIPCFRSLRISRFSKYIKKWSF